MSGVPPCLGSSSLRVKLDSGTKKDEPVAGSGRWKGDFSSVSALISVPGNSRAVPELPLTFLGWEFTCLVSAFRAQSKLACHLPYLAITNNTYAREMNSASQPALEGRRTTVVSLGHLFLLTRE